MVSQFATDMLSKEKQLYKKIIWFDRRVQFDIDFFDLLQPQRQVSAHPRYKSGVFYSEKCGRNIQYESGMELKFIRQLEEMENVRFYYEQPVQIRYRRGPRKRTYTPDFGIYLDTQEFVLVEIKDLPSMLEDKVQMKAEVLLDFCAEKGFGLLFFDGQYTFDKLLKGRNNRQLEKAVLSAMGETVLRKRQYDEIAKACRSTLPELWKVVIKHNLRFRSYPFKLQRGNKNQLFRQVFIEKKRYDDLVKEKFATLFG